LQYAARTAALEAEVLSREQALAELQAELDAVEEDKAKSEDEKRKMRDAYEERMRKMTMQVHRLHVSLACRPVCGRPSHASAAPAPSPPPSESLCLSQVAALKRQQGQQDESRLEKVRMKSELKVQALEGEMARMRQHFEQLKVRLKTNQDAHDEQGKLRAR
jgi:hypothetical protein